MKSLGYLLLTAGFLAGAFATSLHVEEVNWTVFAVAAAAAVIGTIVIKRQASARARSADVLELNRGELRESIENIARDLRELTGSVDQYDGAGLREQIDLKLRTDLTRFVDARESMVHLFGMQTYADIMSSFAAGERYINRVWSASADGYDEEARAYLTKAVDRFIDAQKQLQEASDRTAR